MTKMVPHPSLKPPPLVSIDKVNMINPSLSRLFITAIIAVIP